jgi:Fe-S cluster assembly iron-binding protein IscA
MEKGKAMGTLAQTFFSQRISECRDAFDKGSLGFLRWIGLRLRPSYDGHDDIPEPLRSHYQVLMKHGQVVWGSVAQVNMGMFSAGTMDLPGVTVYSTDPYYDENPQDLFAIGRACFQFKNTDPVDIEFKSVAVRLTDEFDMTVRMLLPNRLTDGREVFLAATMFHRTRLPGGVLRGSLFPTVIAPQMTEANMPLQLPYWSPILCNSWETLQSTLEGVTIGSKAQQVAEAAEKKPVVQNPEPGWNVDTTPVLVTLAMAHAFKSMATASGAQSEPCLLVGIHTDVPGDIKYAEIISDYDHRTEKCFESNGVFVVVRRDQLARMRGAVVDYKESLFGKGILIRLAGE